MCCFKQLQFAQHQHIISIRPRFDVTRPVGTTLRTRIKVYKQEGYRSFLSFQIGCRITSTCFFLYVCNEKKEALRLSSLEQEFRNSISTKTTKYQKQPYRIFCALAVQKYALEFILRSFGNPTRLENYQALKTAVTFRRMESSRINKSTIYPWIKDRFQYSINVVFC